ncbi:MAG: putative porin [bacterium]
MVLKRIFVLMLFGLIAGMLLPVVARAEFPDVPMDHWAYSAVDFLEEEGLVIGYPDGTYMGNRTLTRYEFAMVAYRLYGQFMEKFDALDQQPPIDMEAVLDMLMKEFQPELDELRAMIEEQGAKIDELSGTVGGFDSRIADIESKVDEMNKKFNPTGDLRLQFYGVYPEGGGQRQHARMRLRWGFTSQIADDMTMGVRFASGEIGKNNSNDVVMNDKFGFDSVIIHQAFLKWVPSDYPGFTMWGGKFAPPWKAMPLTTDPDTTVEGLAQYFNWENFNFYAAEMVPAEAGFYFLAQAGVQDLLIEGLGAAVTYHYINSDAWNAMGGPAQDWDNRLQTPNDFRAIELYGEISQDLMNIPVKLQGNYLMNLEKTGFDIAGKALPDEAGWQLGATAKVTLWNTPREPCEWNVWGEWGRSQPNAWPSWLADTTRCTDSEWFGGGWNYRLMRNTDFAIYYFNKKILTTEKKSDIFFVDVTAKF